MAKGWWLNLFLLGVLLAGGGGLWWADQQEAQRKKDEESSRKVSSFSPSEVVALRFQGSDKVPLAMERREGLWRMTQPAGAAVDRRGVEKLLAVLEAVYERKASEGTVKEADFGLDLPAGQLTVTREGGDSLMLTAGGAAPASSHRYVRLGDQGPVVLITSDKVSGLLQDAKELRDRSLLSGLEKEEITGVALERPNNQRLALTKGTGDGWRLEAPLADRGHGTRIATWLDSLVLARGQAFRPVTAPAAPDWRLTVAAGDKTPRQLVIWRDQENLLVSREGEPDAMELSKYLATDLDKKPLELADLRAIEATGEGLTRLAVTWQGKTLEGEKKDQQWPVPAWKSVEEAILRDAVEAMPMAGEVPSVELTILASQGDSQWKVTAWHRDKDLMLAPPDRPVWLRLSTLQTEALTRSLEVLFNPAVEKKDDEKANGG